MICTNIPLFVLILGVNVLGLSAMKIVQKNNHPSLRDAETVRCSDFYGMFFIDNTLEGNKNLLKQILLVENFFGVSDSSNNDGFVTIVSQSNYSVTNNFTVVWPGDFTTFNEQIYSVTNQIPGGNKVSYYDLVFDIYHFKFSDVMKYSFHPSLIFFVNSKIEKIDLTASLISDIKTKESVQVIAIAMDKQYLTDAEQLVGGKENVYVFDSNEENDIVDTNEWVFQKVCPPQPITTPGIPDVLCYGYFNFILVATSEGLSKHQFDLQMDLFKNHVLPMWRDYVEFSRFSLCIILSGTKLDCVPYDTFKSMDDIKKRIDQVSFSNSKSTNLYGAFDFIINNPVMRQRILDMTTFVFLPYISTSEISAATDSSSFLAYESVVKIVTLGLDEKPFNVTLLNANDVFNWKYSNSSIYQLQKFLTKYMNCE